MGIHRVLVVARNETAMSQFLNEYRDQVDYGCTGGKRRSHGKITIEAFVQSKDISQLRQPEKPEIEVQDLGELDTSQIKEEVNKENRFEKNKDVPEGRGIKTKHRITN
jgi:hypothetical protein